MKDERKNHFTNNARQNESHPGRTPMKIGGRSGTFRHRYYAKYLNKPYMRLCFISKDDLRIGEYKEEYKDWEEPLNKELKALRMFWNEGILPDPEPRAYWSKKEQKFVECKYCNYYTKCKEVENGKL